VPQSIPHRFFATQRQSFFADPTDRRAQPYGSFARAHYTFERLSIWSGKTLLQSQRRSGAAAAETELPPQQFRRQRCFRMRPWFPHVAVATLCYVCRRTARAIRHTTPCLGCVREGRHPTRALPYIKARRVALASLKNRVGVRSWRNRLTTHQSSHVSGPKGQQTAVGRSRSPSTSPTFITMVAFFSWQRCLNRRTGFWAARFGSRLRPPD